MAFLICTPVVLLAEGARFTPAAITAYAPAKAAAVRARPHTPPPSRAGRLLLGAARSTVRSQIRRSAPPQTMKLMLFSGITFHTYQQVPCLIHNLLNPKTL